MPIVSNEGGASAPSTGTSAASGASQTTSTPGSSTPSPSSTATPATPQTPASQPSPSPSTPVESTTAPDTFNFDQIFAIDEAPVEAPVVAAPIAAEPLVAPQEPPKPPVGAEPPKPAEAAPVASQVVAQPTRQQGESPPPDPADLGNLARILATNEDAAVKHLAETTFKLSSEEIEALETDAYTVIPKLMARAFVKAQQNVLQLLSKSIPLIIDRQGKVSKAQTEAEGAFFSRWPEIKRDQHGEAVFRIGAAYRQANPNVSRDQMIEDVGTMVMQLAKIPAAAAGQRTAASPMAPATNGSRPPQPSPFVPAGAGVAAAPQIAEGQQWDFLGMDKDE